MSGTYIENSVNYLWNTSSFRNRWTVCNVEDDEAIIWNKQKNCMKVCYK